MEIEDICYIYSTCNLTLVARTFSYVKWVEFIPSHCLNSVAGGNQSLKMNNYEDW